MAIRVAVDVRWFYQDLIKPQKLTSADQLPPVLPIVIDHGEMRWHAPKNLENRTKRLNVLTTYPIRFVRENLSPEIIKLADLYLQQGAIPLKSQVDAFHLAIAVVNQMDILLTWNYQHLANVNRKPQVTPINLANNYLPPLDMVTPLEVINDEL